MALTPKDIARMLDHSTLQPWLTEAEGLTAMRKSDTLNRNASHSIASHGLTVLFFHIKQHIFVMDNRLT